jgi:hypothetical protein
MLTFACPHCRSSLPIPEQAQGKKCRCPKCGQLFRVPAAPPPVAIPVAQPFVHVPAAPLVATPYPATAPPPIVQNRSSPSRPDSTKLIRKAVVTGVFLALAVLFAAAGIVALHAALGRLPPLPVMPVAGIAAYITAGIGGVFLSVVAWRVLTLRMIRALFTLVAAAFVSYYPAAYGFHAWWFRYQVPSMQGRQPMSWEAFVVENWATTDYLILAAGAFFGLLLLSTVIDEHEWPFRGSRPPANDQSNASSATSTDVAPLVWGLVGLFVCAPCGIVAILTARSALRNNPADQCARAGQILGWVAVTVHLIAPLAVVALYLAFVAALVVAQGSGSP